MEKTKWALITGATSGIGLKFSEKLAERGYNILMHGRRADVLNQKADEISTKYSVECETVIGDLVDDSVLDTLVKKGKKIEELEILINNAGFGNTIHFLGDSFKNQQKMLKVHNQVPAYLCHELIPQMAKRGKGFVINVSSLASFTTNPGAEFYGATKAFLNSFSESLQTGIWKKGISVQALCPGFTYTDFHERINIPSSKQKSNGIIRWTSTEKVVDYSLKMLPKLQVVVIPGFWNRRIAAWIKHIPLSIYYRKSANLIKKFD